MYASVAHWKRVLNLDSGGQAGPAYLGKEKENRSYERKLAERESKDESPREEIFEKCRKSTKEVTVTEVWAPFPSTRVEKEPEKTDILKLLDTVYRAGYLNTPRSGLSAGQLTMLWTHKQDEGLYAGDVHTHKVLLKVRRQLERGLGKAAVALKSGAEDGVG